MATENESNDLTIKLVVVRGTGTVTPPEPVEPSVAQKED